MTISRAERKALIKKIKNASGIAQYALDKKLSDEQVIEAAQHLSVLALIKGANDYNRYCQGQKTKAANDRLKEFLDPDLSEIVKAGKWLIGSFSRKGQERQDYLLEKDLVHKQDYNEAISGLHETIGTISSKSDEIVNDAAATISDLEQRIDTLRKHLSKVQEYVSTDKEGKELWIEIRNALNELEKGVA